MDQPKGIEVVKEGIRKLKFTQQLKKSEGTKTPKVELTISVDGLAIQEPKSKKIQHQYPLHRWGGCLLLWSHLLILNCRISYCADDKAEKRFFSFIAKEADSDIHTCYVFVSDKLAEDITLTMGQAFDLAYQRFLLGKSAEPETMKIARFTVQWVSLDCVTWSLFAGLKGKTLDWGRGCWTWPACWTRSSWSSIWRRIM